MKHKCGLCGGGISGLAIKIDGEIHVIDGNYICDNYDHISRVDDDGTFHWQDLEITENSTAH